MDTQDLVEAQGGPTTQLADSRPQLDQPLRVVIPVNAPARLNKSSQDQYIQQNAFSPMAFSQTRRTLPELMGVSNKKSSGGSPDKGKKTRPQADNSDAGIKTAISDFSVLAFSSKRSGKKDIEAMAYVSLGVIHDNQENYLLAIENYQMYGDLCEEMGDSAGVACAMNCLGVDYMLMANPPSDSGFVGDGLSVARTAEANEYLKKAAACHRKHLDIGPDAGGKFVANTNLGITIGMREDVGAAAKCHQDALRIAIKMQTLYGQAISVGNLGMLALAKSDLSTARTCFEQHLQLVQALLDPEAEINAWKMLAKLCTREESFDDALENLDQASRLAQQNQYMNELRRINCLIGVAQGQKSFLGFSEALVAKLS